MLGDAHLGLNPNESLVHSGEGARSVNVRVWQAVLSAAPRERGARHRGWHGRKASLSQRRGAEWARSVHRWWQRSVQRGDCW